MSGSELGDIESLLARALPDPTGFGRKLVDQLMDRMLGGSAVEGVDADRHQALVDRNLLVAAALGACECWGNDLECPLCCGVGTPGWRPPDPQLYEDYVTPAVARRPGTEGTNDDRGMARQQ